MPADRVRPTDLARVPAGVQPQENGRLLCRYCGRWYRSLGRHLRPGHGVTPAQYREEFELPAGRGLMADDLRELVSARSTELLRTNPHVRAAFGVDESVSPERDRRRTRAVARKSETATRAGVKLNQQTLGAALAASSRQRAAHLLRDLDHRAQSLGYRDLEDLLQRTTHLTYRACGTLMGWSDQQVYQWRRKYGLSSSSPVAPTARPHHREQALRAGLDAVPPGVQPVDDHDGLRCLLCGRWYHDLAQHLTNGHQVTADTYRREHHLPPGTALVSPAARKRRADTARQHSASAAAAAATAVSTAARTRHDTAARTHGYADVTALLRDQPSPADVARLLSVTASHARKLRRRYLPPQPRPGI